MESVYYGIRGMLFVWCGERRRPLLGWQEPPAWQQVKTISDWAPWEQDLSRVIKEDLDDSEWDR